MNSPKILISDIDGVLTDGTVFVNEDGKELIQYSKYDGFAMELARAKGLEVILITLEKNSQIHAERAEKIGARLFSLFDKETKAGFIRKYSETHNVSLDDIAFLGDDYSDFEAMKIVGFPFAVRNSPIHRIIKDDLECAYIEITELTSGKGCFREVVEKILGTI